MYFHFPTFFKIIGLVFSGKYFNWRHAALTVLFFVPFILLRFIIWLFWKVDHFFYPEFQKQTIRAPVYIIGNPRSGTTFLHRLMARDTRFAYFQLYQTIFPPVSARKVIDWFGRLDRYLGSPLERILGLFEKKGFAGWDTIHKTGSRHTESDEMLFMYSMLSPLLGLMFPYFSDLKEAVFPDRLPYNQKQRLKLYYYEALQRHMFDSGPEKILLQKVALIAGRIETVLELFPDMRIVYLVRHPYESIPSLISMFQVPWQRLDPEAAKGERANRELGEMIFAYYRAIARIKDSLPEEQFIDIRYDDLVADPKKTVERIYNRFGIEMSESYASVIEKEADLSRQYKSEHHYTLEGTGITREMIYENLKEIFEEYGFEK